MLNWNDVVDNEEEPVVAPVLHLTDEHHHRLQAVLRLVPSVLPLVARQLEWDRIHGEAEYALNLFNGRKVADSVEFRLCAFSSTDTLGRIYKERESTSRETIRRNTNLAFLKKTSIWLIQKLDGMHQLPPLDSHLRPRVEQELRYFVSHFWAQVTGRQAGADHRHNQNVAALRAELHMQRVEGQALQVALADVRTRLAAIVPVPAARGRGRGRGRGAAHVDPDDDEAGAADGVDSDDELAELLAGGADPHEEGELVNELPHAELRGRGRGGARGGGRGRGAIAVANGPAIVAAAAAARGGIIRGAGRGGRGRGAE